MTEPTRRKRRSRGQAPVAREKTPYEELEVTETATAEEIRGAYLAKVRQFPPEREPDGFKRVQKAYSVLKDAARRRVLDLSVFRTRLEPDRPEDAERGGGVDCGALFRERVFLLLLASSDLYAKDFARSFADVEHEIESLS